MGGTARVGSFDGDRSAQFGNRLADTFNQMGLALMLSIGQKTGLLDVLAKLPPSTGREIALAAGLHERYVYEWLACLAAAEVVEFRPESETFFLPREHAIWLTDAGKDKSASAFVAAQDMAEVFAVLMEMQPRVAACFRHGGGVPYSAYGRFHELLAHARNAHFDVVLFSSVLPLIPGWGKAMEQGARVADFGCGSGYVLRLLAQAYPRSHFTGYDISPRDVAGAQTAANELGLVNVRYELADVAGLAVEGVYDFALAFDCIHDLADPGQGVRTIARSLPPGGVLIMQEFAASSRLEENLDHPLGTWLYAQSVMYCLTVSLSQGGAGLGCMWGKEAILEMLAEVGFGDVQVKRTEADSYSDYFVARVSADG